MFNRFFKIEIHNIPEFSKIDGLSDKDYDELQNEIIDLRKKEIRWVLLKGQIMRQKI